MSFWTDLRAPVERELLVGFDYSVGYMRFAASKEPMPLLELMAGYFAQTGFIIEKAGGRLIKTIGDAGLAAFPAEDADAGVLAFLQMQRQGDIWLAENHYPGRAVVSLNLGVCAIGPVGAPGAERLDIYGATVNTAAKLQSTGIAITPAVFRSLSPETRKLFRKHTPPISYVGSTDWPGFVPPPKELLP